ncbi:MAG: helix-turn-helix transcriptional regulator [Nanoarchaeota archaeon]
MTFRDEVAQIRMKNILDKEKEFIFPEFIRCIRKSLNLTRKNMAKEIGMHEMKLYYLETGHFKRIPEISTLSNLADYFHIPKDILVRKAKSFVEDKSKEN